jgi:signal transduction histidine kinase
VLVVENNDPSLNELQKDDLIFDIAHNLRSPLNGLISSIAALTLPASPSPSPSSPSDVSTSLLEVLSHCAQRMSRLIDEMTDYAELTSFATSSPAALQISKVLQSAEELCRPLAKVHYSRKNNR